MNRLLIEISKYGLVVVSYPINMQLEILWTLPPHPCVTCYRQNTGSSVSNVKYICNVKIHGRGVCVHICV